MPRFHERMPAWLLPVVIAAVLAATSYASFASLERALERDLEASLVTLRNSAATAIEIWAAERLDSVELVAAHPDVRDASIELLAIAREAPDPREALLEAPAQARLRESVRGPLQRIDQPGYAVITLSGLAVAHDEDETIGTRDPSVIELLGQLREKESVMSPPLVRDDPGMWLLLATALHNDGGELVGAFGFATLSHLALGRILDVAQAGETGEAYLFDRDGYLLSSTRFEEELRGSGLVGEEESAVAKVQIRDPGGELSAGYVPTGPAAARPLTLAAASAIEDGRGANAVGYRDYRGTMVVGAWTWLPELDVGLIVEIDRVEAYAPVYAARRTFRIVFGLLMAGALGLFLYSRIAERLRREMDEVRQLGRYTIESRIGKGGMGTVYLARHAMLRRPTAIKVLDDERAGKEGIERFKREVQTTSALRHPNTIEIYDYGTTAEGTFYYAMEYVPGWTLASIIEHSDPMPEARVVNLLRQICGSIAEAHEAGLIHRDLKPTNVMLCERGGIYDFVKVLDFGLVRREQQTADIALTDTSSLTGTPQYMSPEAVRSPESLDVRGDVYQLGLIAYVLLTGEPPFRGETPMDVMLKHVHEAPIAPSERLGRPVSPDLEELVLDCLAKDPDDRPKTAGELGARLARCRIEGSWSERDARDWWASWSAEMAAREPEAGSAPESGSLPSGMDLGERTPVS